MIPEAIHQGPSIEERRGPGDGRLHVLIADHDELALSSMRTALYGLDNVGIVTTAHDGREALELARYYRPGVLVAEMALPPSGAVELTGSVLQVAPQTRVVTVAVNDDEAALAALRAGAVGHIEKDIDPNQLAELVARAAAGEAIVPQRLVVSLLELMREVPDTGWRPLRSRLTTREWEIVEHLAEGVSTQHIAERLVLSPTTVYSHVKSVMRKLGVHSRRDAVVAAERLRHEESSFGKAHQWRPSKFAAHPR